MSQTYRCAVSGKRLLCGGGVSRHFKRRLSLSSKDRYAQLPIIAVGVDDTVAETFQDEKFVPRRHPGVMFRGVVCLPTEFTNAAKRLLGNNHMKSMTPKMEEFRNYLVSRKEPIDKKEYKQLCDQVEGGIRSRDEIMEPFLSGEELEALEKRRFAETKKALKGLVYHWEPINYAGSQVLEYLMVRSDAEYAALYRIFSEIAKRDPDFAPAEMLDFGSGLGTSVWAANAFWNKSLTEHLCVDTSADMNDAAELILKDNNHNKPPIFKNVFYRQFLPSSPTRKYDLVTAAYSLFDLSSVKARVDVLHTLWRKCSKYLVIVEHGTNPGFQLINEAREFTLRLDRNTFRGPDGHVFSPCPHDFHCPRHKNKSTCKFRVRYRSMIPFEKEVLKQETFTYTVFKKGERSPEHLDWPRVLDDPMLLSKHVRCKLCMADGKLYEAVLTKKSTPRMMYKASRKSKAGDLLPAKIDKILHPPPKPADLDGVAPEEGINNPEEINEQPPSHLEDYNNNSKPSDLNISGT